MAKKQKNGLYRTKIKVGVDVNGKDIVKWISGKTKRELEEARRQAEEYYITGTGLLEDRLFGEYAAEWYKVRKAPFISPSSQASYRTILNLHVLPAFGDRNLRAIQPVELQMFLNRFRGRSKSQITNVLSVLNGVYSAALTDRLVARNPMQGIRRPEDTPPAEKRALTEEERKRFRTLFSTHPHGLYLAMMFFTGMRAGGGAGASVGRFRLGRSVDPRPTGHRLQGHEWRCGRAEERRRRSLRPYPRRTGCALSAACRRSKGVCFPGRGWQAPRPGHSGQDVD